MWCRTRGYAGSIACAVLPLYNVCDALAMDARCAIMTILYTALIFLEHQTGAHPENANRLRAIMARLEKSGLIAQCARGGFEPLAEETVAQLHSLAMIARARETAARGGGFLDADT